MGTEGTTARCSRCGTVTPVPADWRVLQCPKCGDPIIRMEEDSKYD